MTKRYNKTNFHKYTFCIFLEVDFDVVKDLKPNYTSKSGSSYYFINEGVYRLSNHWGRAANCKWRLSGSSKSVTLSAVKMQSQNNVTLSAVEVSNSNRTKLGFAKWTDFYPDNDYEKLYFIEADFENKTVNFFHKQDLNFSDEMILRTSTETTKLIKQIRTLFDETAWAKYLNLENIAVLRKEIIDRLITTNLSFQEIRKEYL